MTVLADRYRLDQLLGRGGVADVYRARDLVLDRDVALKVLRETVDESDRARFVGEAGLLARLSHPGLVIVLDAGTSGTQPFLVMELVRGSTLAALLREGPLAPEQAARIGSRLALALAYAHDQGVVHRDVKPANVLLTPDGEPKLADFGIARLVGSTTQHTRTGTTIGTPAYLSPEQVRGTTVGPPADVYSLGLVLLEGLTGDRSFTGPPVEAALARLHRPPVVPEHLPDPWRRLIAAMTATEPDDRPTAAAVAAALESGDATMPTATLVLDSPPATAGLSSKAAASKAASSRAMAGVAAAALVLVATVAAVVALDDDPASDDGPGISPTSSATSEPTEPTDPTSATSTPPQTEPVDPGDGNGEGKGKDKDKDKKGKKKDKGGKGKGGDKGKGGKGKG